MTVTVTSSVTCDQCGLVGAGLTPIQAAALRSRHEGQHRPLSEREAIGAALSRLPAVPPAPKRSAEVPKFLDGCDAWLDALADALTSGALTHDDIRSPGLDLYRGLRAASDLTGSRPTSRRGSRLHSVLVRVLVEVWELPPPEVEA